MSEFAHRPSRRRFLRAGGMALTGCGLGRAAVASAELPPAPPADGPDESYWSRLREHFPLPSEAHLNTGSLGVMPHVVLARRAEEARRLAADPTDPYRREARDAVRARLAGFVGAEQESVALTRSTTEGMNIFAHGLDWRPGDEVVMSTHEHGGASGPYRTLAARRGIRIRWVELPLGETEPEAVVARYREALGPRTRALVVSHLTFTTGLLLPVAELCELAHRHGALISVDGAHTLGMLPLELAHLDCDHFAGSGQKWLCAGPGSGLCYVHPERQGEIWPLMGYADPEAGEGAVKYEAHGQPDVPALLALEPALVLQQRVGREVVAARVGELGGALREGLAGIDGVRLWTPQNPALSAGLTSFSIPGVPAHRLAAAISRLVDAHVLAMPVGDLDAVRVSTHIYNTPEEIEAVLRAVRRVAGNPFEFV